VAATFAFATGVGHVLPPAAIPLRALAALVAYSRVHTGVGGQRGRAQVPAEVSSGAASASATIRAAASALTAWRAIRS
jgi:hypothetical protein